jgi:Baseplate J-like protein
VVRVGGIEWTESPSLYGAGRAEVFAVRLEKDGGLTVQFGDGEQGARLPTGRGNVASTYRIGGGTAGEVESRAIDSLLGSVRGVKKVEGAGPTSGGADQDDERRLRTLVPARARAFGRAVSIGDLVDLSLGYTGVTHAAAWDGTGPPGCACGGSGLHLAFVRAGHTGVRAPDVTEIDAIANFLDARRDATVPLCACAAVLPEPRPKLTVQLAVDPRRLVTDVVAAATSALVDPAGLLAPLERALGQPLDRSDVFAVLHAVAGVVGVTSLDLPGAVGELGRRPAERYELIVLDPEPAVGGAAA